MYSLLLLCNILRLPFSVTYNHIFSNRSYRNSKGDIINPHVPDEGGFGGPESMTDHRQTARKRMNAKFQALGPNGIVECGVHVNDDDVLVNKYSPQDQSGLSGLGGPFHVIAFMLARIVN